MLKLKLQYFGHLMQRTDTLEKILMVGKIEGGRRRGQQRMRWLELNELTELVCHEVMGLGATILVFLLLSFKPAFSLSSFTVIQRLLSSSSLSAIRVVSPAYLRLLIFLLAILILACDSSSLALCRSTVHMS